MIKRLQELTKPEFMAVPIIPGSVNSPMKAVAVNAATPLETAAMAMALAKIVTAVCAYLPPDGMTAEELVNTVIEAVDNPEFNKAMGAK